MSHRNNDYIILQNKNFKVPLLSRNGVWNFEINKVKWGLPDCMERLYAYLIIGENDFKSVAGTLRANNKHISALEIDNFIVYFESTHPVETICFDLDVVPIYATDSMLLRLPNPFSYDILLTHNKESELLNIIKTADKKRDTLQQWFRRYVNRYALTPRYKRDVELQYEELSIAFCRQHGINYYQLSNCRTNQKRMSPIQYELSLILIGLATIAVIILIFELFRNF